MEPVKGYAHLYPKTFPFEIQPLKEADVSNIQTAIKSMEEALFLRDAYTGLNPIQDFLLSYRDQIKSHEDIVALCSVHFKLPLSKIKIEFYSLLRGNYPIWDWKGEDFPLPFALVNGPYPYSGVRIIEYIKETIETGKHPNVDHLDPQCKGYFIVQHSRDGVCIENQKDRRPYHYCENQSIEPWYKDPRYPPVESVIQWDEKFAQGTFTPNQLFDYWYERRIDHCLNLLPIKRKEYDKIERKKIFIRNIFCNAMASERDSRGREYRIFTDEPVQVKRMRVGEDLDFLNIPLVLLDEDYIDSDTQPVPQSARDLILQQLEHV